MDYDRERAMVIMMQRLTILMLLILIFVAIGLYILYNNINNDNFSYTGILVFVGGVLGGFVSIQQRLYRIKDEELRLLSASWLSTALIPINGGIFAIVLMLMFMAQLLQGSLFPTFPDLNVSNVDSFKDWLTYAYPQTGSGMAKLFFWSFVAGFSERVVPRIINNVVESGISNSYRKELPNSNNGNIKENMPMQKSDKGV